MRAALALLAAAQIGAMSVPAQRPGNTPVPAASSPVTPASETPAPRQLPIPGAHAVGDLLVAPTRVVFEGRQRTGELTLVNIGTQTATYRISFVNMRMNEMGEFTEINEPGPGEQVVDQLIRYSPRQVTLEPQVAQTVRLQLRKPADLPTGEYRSHMLFRAVPVAEPAAGKPGDASGLSIRLRPIYGVSIPIIVRQGETSATLRLSDLQLRPGAKPGDPPVLQLKMSRAGNQSIYGNLNVTFSSRGAREQVVGIVNGIAVYTPNPFRIVQIALRPPPSVTLAHGRLRVTCVKEKASTEKLAEAELELP